ncbi:hypothetical protein HJC23_005650 [Cyclotella cryptica]|uniref:Uncharacterized protein n=1 Tax=Cyclotella cryptica TaxID=29204 RepID=A0ABD3PYA5_9STRA
MQTRLWRKPHVHRMSHTGMLTFEEFHKDFDPSRITKNPLRIQGNCEAFFYLLDQDCLQFCFSDVLPLFIPREDDKQFGIYILGKEEIEAFWAVSHSSACRL